MPAIDDTVSHAHQSHSAENTPRRLVTYFSRVYLIVTHENSFPSGPFWNIS
jgi:hypothetical protein